MKWLLALLLVFIVSSSTVQAEMLDETVSEVQVPGEVLWDVQGDMQGYIIYKIEESTSGYIAEVARDSEPHQFPVFTYTYDGDWNLVSKSNVAPKIDAPIPNVQPKPEPAPMPRVAPPPVPVPQPTPPPTPVQPVPVEPPEEPSRPPEEEVPIEEEDDGENTMRPTDI